MTHKISRSRIGILSGLIFLSASVGNAFALESEQLMDGTLLPRYTTIDKENAYPLLPMDKIDGIVIKFVEGSGVRIKHNGKLAPNQSKKLKSKLPSDKSNWLMVEDELERLERSFKYYKLHKLKPLFDLKEDVIESMKIKGQKRKGYELADLNLYFHLDLPKQIHQSELNELLQELNSYDIVEIAYVNPIPESASISAPIDYDCPDISGCGDYPGGGSGGGTSIPTPDYINQQGYLLPASQGGIDAFYSWTKPGGTGTGVNVVDIENGWNFAHEDINSAFYFGGTNQTDIDHGTAVVGVVGARNNGKGITGISHGSRVGAEGLGSNFSTRIIRAANAVGNGGVIIIEAHQQSGINLTCTCNETQCGFVAMEYWQANFDAIQTAVANGVTVVEAGGNGSVNLDDVQLGNRFNRNVRDSGAILVGASRSTARLPTCWTNNGSRIDMHGWGEHVVTTGYGDLFNQGTNRRYTQTFAGTSSASPIVAGAAINLQGYAKAELQTTLDPLTIRHHLVSTGTAQSGGANIGPLPNLRNAIGSMSTLLISPTANSYSTGCYGQNTINWNGVPNASSYQIYVRTNSELPTGSPTYTVSGTIKNLSVSQLSYAWVKACNSNACSDFSNRVSLVRLPSCR